MKHLISIAVVLLLVGCGSTRPVARSEQFCDLKSETLSVKDKSGRVVDEASVDYMKCSDNPVERMSIAKIGISSNCGEYKYWMTLGGHPVQRTGYACKKFDGTWEVVPSNFR